MAAKGGVTGAPPTYKGADTWTKEKSSVTSERTYENAGKLAVDTFKFQHTVPRAELSR